MFFLGMGGGEKWVMEIAPSPPCLKTLYIDFKNEV